MGALGNSVVFDSDAIAQHEVAWWINVELFDGALRALLCYVA